MRLRTIAKETKGGTALHSSHIGLLLAVKGWGKKKKSRAWLKFRLWTNSLKNLPGTLKRGKYTEDNPESQAAASVLGTDSALDTCHQLLSEIS